jgi:hypothetical protein
VRRALVLGGLALLAWLGGAWLFHHLVPEASWGGSLVALALSVGALAFAGWDLVAREGGRGLATLACVIPGVLVAHLVGGLGWGPSLLLGPIAGLVAVAAILVFFS